MSSSSKAPLKRVYHLPLFNLLIVQEEVSKPVRKYKRALKPAQP